MHEDGREIARDDPEYSPRNLKKFLKIKRDELRRERKRDKAREEKEKRIREEKERKDREKKEAKKKSPGPTIIMGGGLLARLMIDDDDPRKEEPDVKNYKPKAKKKGKKKKDPTLPKGPSGSYIQFTTEQIPIIRKENMNSDGTAKIDPKTKEPFKHTTFMAMAGQRWKDLNSNDKKKYELLAEKDKARYEKQKAEHDEKGYFTLANGTKSNNKVIASPSKNNSRSKSPIIKKQSAKTIAKKAKMSA